MLLVPSPGALKCLLKNPRKRLKTPKNADKRLITPKIHQCKRKLSKIILPIFVGKCLPSRNFGDAKVLPDLPAVALGLDEDDQTLFADQEAAFFSRKRPREASGRKNPDRVRRPKKTRQSAYAVMRAVDHQLHSMTGTGLSQFIPQDGSTNIPLQSRPLLVVCLDEGSVGYAAVWYWWYSAGLRMLPMRDVFHREWNDVLMAVRNCGLYSVLLLTQLVYNLSHGPWAGAAWWEQLKVGAQNLQAHDGGELFDLLYPAVCHDFGEAAVGTLAHKRAVLRQVGGALVREQT